MGVLGVVGGTAMDDAFDEFGVPLHVFNGDAVGLADVAALPYGGAHSG